MENATSPTALPRSIVSVQLMVRLAGEHGLMPAPALAGSGITVEDLMNPQAEILPIQELRVIDNLVKALPQITDLGLQAGRRYHLSLYGVWGFALATSPTPRAMAQIATRYLDLSFAFARFSLGQRAQRPMVELLVDHLPPDVQRFALERDFAALVNVMVEILPGVPVFDALDFRGPPPPHAAAYTALCHQLGAPLMGLIQIGSAWNRLQRRRDGLPWIGWIPAPGEPERGLALDHLVQELRRRSLTAAATGARTPRP